MMIREEVLELLRTDPVFREEVRRQLLTEELLALPGLVRELTEAQRRTEVQVQRLAEQVQALVSWQRGEAGRRDGERYERDIIRRAPALFNGGQGGSPDQPWVQQRLTALLGALLGGDLLPAEEDPYVADLLWWKGEQVAVVEVSLKVDREDVTRAARRAASLRRAGATAVAVVIGEDWTTRETKSQAQASQVEWKVGANLSKGFLAFRRRPAT